jgi:aspartate/methionine/tyrosine aminotransferase
LVVDHSEAGLYLWARDGARDRAGGAAPTEADSWALVGQLADLGLLVGPGTFYGAAGNGYVRVAITATDDAVARAAERLRNWR